MVLRTTLLVAAFIGVLPLVKPDELAVAKPAMSFIGLGTLQQLNGSSDGRNPTNSMFVASDGNLYGTTLLGGNGYYGTFYKVTATGGRISPTVTYTVLHHFRDGSVSDDGHGCYGKLVQDGSGYIYGNCGGSDWNGLGMVYRIDPSNGAFTVIRRFSDGSVSNDGARPFSGLVMVADTMYGTTSVGGVSCVYSWSTGCGTIYKLTKSGGSWTYSVLYRFAGGSSGEYPVSITLGSDGNLYGTTEYGGTNGEGTIWRYNLSTSTFTKLVDANVGDYSYGGGLTQIPTSFTSSTLEFWGTTKWGGANGYGSVYKLVETSVGSGSFNYSTVHDFNSGTNEGYCPIGRLIFSTNVGGFQDSGGAIYGTTYCGGVSGPYYQYGSLFRIDYSTEAFWEPPNDGAWSGAYPQSGAWGLVQSSISGTPVLFGSSTDGPPTCCSNGNGWLWHVWLQ